MKKIIGFLALAILAFSCQPSENKELNTIFEDFYEEKLRYFPLEATSQGDNRFNDQLPIDISESFRNELRTFYQKFSDRLEKINQKNLTEDEKIYYDTFRFTLNTEIEGLNYPIHLIPFNQFTGLPLTLGQLGSGSSSQPFNTPQDYQNWLSRIDKFTVWADTAIANFNKGVASQYVLPASLVKKMIPQMESLTTGAIEDHLFFGPVKQLPATISADEKSRITKEYSKAISEKVIPTYKKLADYLKNEYLPKARESSGILSLKGGLNQYAYHTYYWTTSLKSTDEIFQIGLAEVSRIRKEMEKVKDQVGYKGDLNAFMNTIKKDPKLMPFNTPEEVLEAFKSIQKKIDPNLKKMFNLTPKTKFEIRRTEAFREASASAEYMQGSADGSRPGIFYVPIPNAKEFNITSGMESLFLHEAIPGHHYQVSLQQENLNIPKFMRFGWYGAYGEGWALYTESLGKELGLYTDPYQYMGALGDEIHRAIRLVVDVGIHTKGWTREQALQYMLENEAISDQGAIAEIERYMAVPGQALSYKIGSLKIRELRSKYQGELGEKFSLAGFHDEILRHGCLPLDILQEKMDLWAQKQKK